MDDMSRNWMMDQFTNKFKRLADPTTPKDSGRNYKGHPEIMLTERKKNILFSLGNLDFFVFNYSFDDLKE